MKGKLAKNYVKPKQTLSNEIRAFFGKNDITERYSSDRSGSSSRKQENRYETKDTREWIKAQDKRDYRIEQSSTRNRGDRNLS